MKPRTRLIAGIAVLAVVIVVLVSTLSGDDGNGNGVEGVEVRRGPLRISVVERGNLKAENSVKLKSEVEGSSTILFLVEEGVWVQPGDLVCELDAANLVEKRVQQEIVVQNQRAGFTKAQQNYEIQLSQNESDVKRAEREEEFARADRVKYLEGDWPLLEKAAQEAIVLAEEELKRAQQELAWSEKLAGQGFLESTQLEADRLAAKSADIKLKQVQRALELLRRFDHPRTLKELDADVDEKGRELVRVRLQAKARIADFEADLAANEAKLKLEEEKLAKIVSQIDKARIVAPVAGMVVYAREGGGRWRDGEPIQEGTSVRERQEIVTIPEAGGMLVEVSLHESVLESVEEGMPCLVTVDALPDAAFSGKVVFKAVLPDQNSWWANPDLRVYRTEVEVLELDERMRPGMSCSVEIMIDEVDDAFHVPVQAVFLNKGEPVAFVESGGATEVRPIEVGRDNGKWVEVLSGLTEGEQVLLSQPPGVVLEPAEGTTPRPPGRPRRVDRAVGRDAKRAARAAPAGRTPRPPARTAEAPAERADAHGRDRRRARRRHAHLHDGRERGASPGRALVPGAPRPVLVDHGQLGLAASRRCSTSWVASIDRRRVATIACAGHVTWAI